MFVAIAGALTESWASPVAPATMTPIINKVSATTNWWLLT